LVRSAMAEDSAAAKVETADAPVASEGTSAEAGGRVLPEVSPVEPMDVAAKTDTLEAAAEPETTQEMEVAVALLGFVADRAQEVERLSGARVEIVPAKDGEDMTHVRVCGSALKVTRARVLLEDHIRNAPSGASGSTAAPAGQASKPQAGDIACRVAGRAFADRSEINEYIQKIQTKLGEEGTLNQEESFFFLHLFTHHEHWATKAIAPIVGFKYGPHETFPESKCFFMVFEDGTTESISVRKCLEHVCPQGKTAQKREREANAAAEEPPAKRPQREIVTGCIVVISGVPAATEYGDLKDLLNEYGNCRFVEFIRPEGGRPEKAAAAAEHRPEKAAAAAKQVGDSDLVDGDEDMGKVEGETEAPPAAGEAAEKGEAKTASQEAATEEKPKTEPQEAAAETKEGGGEADAEMDGSAEKAEAAKKEEGPRQARARFGDAESAAACIAELKEVDGVAVTTRVLAGDEERNFWERLWQAADKGKGKGKGKGKDKGKGKGKKGKGKGKKGKK